jgi:hypothetical protein
MFLLIFSVFLSTFVDLISANNSLCDVQLQTFDRGLYERKDWAIKSKNSSKLKVGNLISENPS